MVQDNQKSFGNQANHSEPSRHSIELSVVIPCFNERETIRFILDALISTLECSMQIIVVDDASTDGTFEAAQAYSDNVEVVRLSENRGKGAAVRRGLELAAGRYVVIQDADLEYDPVDLNRMLAVIRDNPGSAVYGSRYLDSGRHKAGAIMNYYGVKVLNLSLAILYGKRITDSATCYKMLPRDVVDRMNLSAERFELCPEINSKLCRMKVPIIEIPISYIPRKKSEGKKIRCRDFWEAIGCYRKYSGWNPATTDTNAMMTGSTDAPAERHHSSQLQNSVL